MMGIVTLLIGTGLMLAAVYLFLKLRTTVISSLPQKRITYYFLIYPTLFQIIFHLMFLSFPVAAFFVTFQGITANNQDVRLMGLTALVVIWPVLMCRIHWAFVDFSMKLGISSRTVAVEDSISYARLKVIGWIGAVAIMVLGFYLKVNGNSSFLRILFSLGTGGILLIPIRKPLDIIRGKKSAGVLE